MWEVLECLFAHLAKCVSQCLSRFQPPFSQDSRDRWLTGVWDSNGKSNFLLTLRLTLTTLPKISTLLTAKCTIMGSTWVPSLQNRAKSWRETCLGMPPEIRNFQGVSSGMKTKFQKRIFPTPKHRNNPILRKVITLDHFPNTFTTLLTLYHWRKLKSLKFYWQFSELSSNLTSSRSSKWSFHGLFCIRTKVIPTIWQIFSFSMRVSPVNIK